MPELAEVEYFRRQWDAGLRQRIQSVSCHRGKRIFRGTDEDQMARVLSGALYLGSETRGKQIGLRFSGHAWLGIHLGMSGELRVEPAGFTPGRHDHLVLHQARRSLVLADPRMFGRVRFHVGRQPPEWWSAAPPSIGSPEFSLKWMSEGLKRRRVAIKAALLSQTLFPGIGNWMADEILWQARIHPRAIAADLSEAALRRIYQTTRKICAVALKTIGVNWGDPPKNWLIHVRWKKAGRCPRDQSLLERATIGGRTTAWCPVCQRLR